MGGDGDGDGMVVAPGVEEQSLGARTDSSSPCHTHRGLCASPRANPAPWGAVTLCGPFIQLQTGLGAEQPPGLG